MKSQLSIVEKRAVSSQNLQNRLNFNRKLSSKDLTKWLFKRYKIRKNEFILELGCGVGNHVLKEAKIVKQKGLILATDYSKQSLEVLKKKNNYNNIKIKCISMDEISKYLKKKKIFFDKIISSYAIYYAKDPLKVILNCSKFLKPNGSFLITAPCYPHTLTSFASHERTLPKIARKYIDFSTKKLEPYLKRKKIKCKVFKFQNKLRFKKVDDLLDFYRSTVFYSKKSERNLFKLFYVNKNKSNYFNIIKSAKLYKFSKILIK